MARTTKQNAKRFVFLSDKLRKQIIPLLILALALFARILPGARTIDDAFITYRYVSNLLAGNGFVFNLGEHVLGTTTPFYTLLLTFLGLLFPGSEIPFPQIALFLNAVAGTLTCVLVMRLGELLHAPQLGRLAAALWALAPYSVTFAIGGLETSVYVLLLTALMLAHLENRHYLAAMFASLALLTRPDALIVVALIALDRLMTLKLWSSERAPIHAWLPELLIFSLPTLIWFAFAQAYFGSIIPHSITAKRLVYDLPSTAALTRLLQHYATPFLGHLTFGIPWIGVGLLLYPFLFLIGSRLLLSKSHRLWPYLLYPPVYFALFSLANPLIFRWYLTPPLLPYIIAILFGANEILVKTWAWIGRHRPYLQRSAPALFTLLALLPILMTLRGWVLHPGHGPDRPAPAMAWFQLELLYRKASEDLSAVIHQYNEPPLLAAGDVGVLGYYTEARILDTVGLNSPVSLAYYPIDPAKYVINYAIPVALILDQKPDLIVILEVYGRETLLADERFLQSYHLLETIPTDIYSSRGMLVFQKNSD